MLWSVSVFLASHSVNIYKPVREQLGHEKGVRDLKKNMFEHQVFFTTSFRFTAQKEKIAPKTLFFRY